MVGSIPQESTLRGAVQTWLNGRILRLAKVLPQMRRGAFASVQMLAKSRRKWGQRQSVAIPEGAQLDVLSIVFYDLYYVEDFPRLELGLRSLRRMQKGFLFPRLHSVEHSLAKWNETFDGGAAWTNLGAIQPIVKKGHANHLDMISLALHRITSSAACLELTAWPSKLWKRKFFRIISKGVPGRLMLDHFNLITGSLSASHVFPEMAQQEQIDELFLNINRTVAGILKSHVRVGWCLSGVLPSVRTFFLRKGQFQQSKADVSFWQSLRMPSMHPFVYGHEGVVIFPPDALPERSSLPSYQILVLPEYAKKESGKLPGQGDVNLWLDLWNGELCGLLPILAVREQVRRLAREVAESRGALGSDLAGRKRVPGSILLSGRVFRQMARLNSLAFRFQRLNQELKLNPRRRRGTDALEGYSRKQFGADDSGLMVDDLEWQTKLASRFANAQLKLLTENYHEMLNYRLQQVLLFLAAVTAFLTLVLILPEAPRVKLLTSVWKALTGLF